LLFLLFSELQLISCVFLPSQEFAAFAGKKEAVAALTAKAMGGSVKFEDALASRLSLINPTAELLARFLVEHKFEFTEGLVDFMDQLKARGVDIYLVSGGFTQMIHPVADILSIPRERVFANTILFDDAGNYRGFDQEAPTSRDGGKPAVVSQLKKFYGAASPIVMIGDGATDMQARPPADAFIGYGGVVERAPVKAGADLFVKSFRELLAHL
jgi:phosphoserine phosphatase